jgi:Flp pilus assembly protein TadG
MRSPIPENGRSPVRARGIATIEFILTAPLLILLMIAVVEVGRIMVQYAMLSSAVRSSARFVAGEAYKGSTGVVNVGTTLQGQGKNLVVYGTIVGGSAPLLPGLTTSQVTVQDAGAGNVSVTAIYPYSPIGGVTLPDLGFSGTPISLSFDMTSSATMRGLP